MLDDGLPESAPVLRVLEGVLIGRPGDPDGLGGHGGPARLERGHGCLAGRLPPCLCLRHALVELLLAAEQAAAGQHHVAQHDLGGVRRPDSHLLELLPHLEPGGLRWYDEARLPFCPELGRHARHDHMDIGDAAVRDPSLRTVEGPGVGRLVVDRPRPQLADVRAGVGLRDAERSHPEITGAAEALRRPFADLLGRAVRDDPGEPEGGAEDRQPDTGVPPGHLLVHRRQQLAGRISKTAGDEVERVQPNLSRLLDDRPRRLLPLVPLVSRRSQDILGELVDPLDHLQLVLVHLERKVTHLHAPCVGVGRRRAVRGENATASVGRDKLRRRSAGAAVAPLLTAQ